MKIENIYEGWGSIVHTSYNELMSLDADTFWKPLFYSRNLLLIRGISNSLISDVEFIEMIKKFGRPWEWVDHKNLFPPNRQSNRLKNRKENEPVVSYLTSETTPWGKGVLDYHADIPLMGKQSYPCRSIYMTNLPLNDTGITSWLNLEYAWEQCSEEEKTYIMM
jgi:hypothetical protein